MKIVVIGGSGLIGTHVVAQLLAQGHEVVAASPRTGVDTVSGEGLAQALAGAQVVVDVSNAPSFEDQAVLDFFRTSTGNLLRTAKAANVQHLLVLSVVGSERLPDSGYFRAKVVQEDLVRAGGLPFTIVRATQFFEFIASIADASAAGDAVRVPSALFQPMAAKDVSELVATLALREPANGTIEIAGPTAASMGLLVSQLLHSKGDRRRVIAAPDATYFGAPITDATLVPASGALQGRIAFEQWLQARA